MTPEAFKEARRKLGLTQTEMGKELGGYALRTVQSWEAGERAIPAAVSTLAQLLLIAEPPAGA